MVFIEDEGFQRRRKGLLDDEELFELMGWLALRPDAGKAHWAAKGHGKRGGARVIYFWWVTDDQILLLDVYAKNWKEDMSADEINKLKRKVIK